VGSASPHRFHTSGGPKKKALERGGFVSGKCERRWTANSSFEVCKLGVFDFETPEILTLKTLTSHHLIRLNFCSSSFTVASNRSNLRQVSGTEPIDAAVADFAGSKWCCQRWVLVTGSVDVVNGTVVLVIHWCFAGAVIYMGELKDTVDVQIQARVEDDWSSS